MSKKENKTTYTVEAPLSELKAQRERERSDRIRTIAFWVIIALIIGLSVAAAVALVLQKKNAGSNVRKAFTNTFSDYAKGDNLLFSAVNIKNIVEDKDYTISIDGSTFVPNVGEAAITADIGVGTDKLQALGDLDIGYGLPVIQYELQLDDNRLKAHFPLLNDYLLSYDYVSGSKDSPFSDLLNQLLKIDTSSIDEGLSSIYGFVYGTDTKEITKELTEVVSKEVDTLEFKNLKPRKFVIDGMEKRCRGYEVSITNENIINIADRIDEIFNERYSDVIELDSIGATVKDIADSLRTTANKFNNITAYIYIYKSQLASVRIVGDNNTAAEILFRGGDYRAQNISISSNGKEYISIEGDIANEEENMLIITPDNLYISYVYDSGTGDLDISLGTGEDAQKISCNIKNDGNSLRMDFDTIDLGSTYFVGNVTVSDGIEMKELPGKEIDLNSSESDDLVGLVINIIGLSSQFTQP